MMHVPQQEVWEELGWQCNNKLHQTSCGTTMQCRQDHFILLCSLKALQWAHSRRWLRAGSSKQPSVSNLQPPKQLTELHLQNSKQSFSSRSR